MAHVMKFTKANCGHMFAHFDRSANNISNENINSEKTHLNYNLANHQQMNQIEFMNQRCSEVKCQNRKDVNVMASWVITVPKDLPVSEHKDFFKSSYDFLESRYGKENVISAYVHMDETTPHMHFAFVPVAHGFKKDKKNPDINHEYYKVSAKEVLNRQELKEFHPDLQKYVESKLGHEVNILNEATKEGNKSIDELKRGSAIKKLNQIKEEYNETAVKTSEMRQICSNLENEVNTLSEQKNALNRSISGLNEEFSNIKTDFNNIEKIEKEAKIKKDIFGKEKNIIELPKNIFDFLIKMLKKLSLKDKNNETKIKELNQEIKELKAENKKLKPSMNERMEQAKRIAELEGILKKIPKDVIDRYLNPKEIKSNKIERS